MGSCCEKSAKFAIDTDTIPEVDVSGGSHNNMTSRQIFKAMGLKDTPAGSDLHYYPKGGWQKLMAHENIWHILFIVEGQGEYQVGEETYKVKKNSLVYVPPGAMHAVKNTGDGTLTLLFVAGKTQ